MKRKIFIKKEDENELAELIENCTWLINHHYKGGFDENTGRFVVIALNHLSNFIMATLLGKDGSIWPTLNPDPLNTVEGLKKSLKDLQWKYERLRSGIETILNTTGRDPEKKIEKLKSLMNLYENENNKNSLEEDNK